MATGKWPFFNFMTHLQYKFFPIISHPVSFLAYYEQGQYIVKTKINRRNLVNGRLYLDCLGLVQNFYLNLVILIVCYLHI